MIIVKTENGFIQHQENEVVDYVECNTNNGTCTVYYKNKMSYDLDIGCDFDAAFYGLPVSNDGKMMFMGSWENWMKAFDVATGKMVWELKRTRIRHVLVYDDYLIVRKDYSDIFKINLSTGEIIDSLKGTNICFLSKLEDGNMLVAWLKGNICVVDTKRMQIIKEYKKAVTNPDKCLAHDITGAKVENNKLIILGRERHPDKEHYLRAADPSSIEWFELFEKYTINFERVIDENYT